MQDRSVGSYEGLSIKDGALKMQLSHKQILQNIMVIAIGKRKEIDFHEK